MKLLIATIFSLVLLIGNINAERRVLMGCIV